MSISKLIKELFAWSILLVAICMIVFLIRLYMNFKVNINGDGFGSEIHDNINKNDHVGTIFENHPFRTTATMDDDYNFAVKQISEYNVQLSDLDQYLIDNIYNGTLSYGYIVKTEGAGMFYVFGDGKVYRIYCTPYDSVLCEMPIMSSIVVNAYQGWGTKQTKVCKNKWQVFWTFSPHVFPPDLYNQVP